MATGSLKDRVAALEAEVTQLRATLERSLDQPWWEKITGTFADDPIYAEAMRLGLEYRESLRPKASKREKPNSDRARHRSS
jgi:hypothetical protein